MRQWIFLLTLSLSPLVLAGCKRDQPAAPPPGKAEVKVSLPVQRKVIDYEYFTGRTEAYQKVEIRARVTGHLEQINFKDGDIVKEDQKLFVIDQKLFKSDLANAKAALEQEEAHFSRVDADLARATPLFERGAIGREEYDKYRGDRAELRAAVSKARAAVDRAEKNLTYTELRAPFTGRISRRMIDKGNLVKQDETVLSTLVTLEPTYAYFDVDERTLLRDLLKRNSLSTARAGKAKIDIGLADEQGYPHTGTVDFVDNSVDVNTGTMWMRGVFDYTDRELTPGLFIRVRFPVGQPYDGVLIAEQAIGTDQGQKFVYIIDDEERVQYRDVTVGRLDGGLRVIKKGLTAKDRVVVSGLQRIRAKAEVTPPELIPMPVPRDATSSTADKEQPAKKPTKTEK